jgi:hypothetical protein
MSTATQATRATLDDLMRFDGVEIAAWRNGSLPTRRRPDQFLDPGATVMW